MQRLVAELHFERAGHHVWFVAEIAVAAARNERRDGAETRLLHCERAGAGEGGDDDGCVGGFLGRDDDLRERRRGSGSVVEGGDVCCCCCW